MTSTIRPPQASPARGSARATALAGGLHPFGVLILLAGAFMPIMDFFITNVALPSIDASLHASPPALELVIAGYGVAYAALLVLGGRLGDRYGRRRHLPWRAGRLHAGLAGLRPRAVGRGPDRGPHRAGRRRCAAHPAGARHLPPHPGRRAQGPRPGPVRRDLRHRRGGRPDRRRPAGQRRTSPAPPGGRSSWSTCRSASLCCSSPPASCPPPAHRTRSGSTCPAPSCSPPP